MLLVCLFIFLFLYLEPLAETLEKRKIRLIFEANHQEKNTSTRSKKAVIVIYAGLDTIEL